MYFWVEFNNRNNGTVKASCLDEAKSIAASIGDVRRVMHLPYPASPYLNQIDCPAFCYTPNECKGRTCCPKRYSCVD